MGGIACSLITDYNYSYKVEVWAQARANKLSVIIPYQSYALVVSCCCGAATGAGGGGGGGAGGVVSRVTRYDLVILSS